MSVIFLFQPGEAVDSICCARGKNADTEKIFFCIQFGDYEPDRSSI